MKIAYILPSLENRGPVIFTQYLISEVKNYADIEVLYFNDSYKNILNLEVKATKISPFRKYDFSRFDIIHTTMALPDLYASLFVPGKKWICSMHNYLVEDVKMSHSKSETFFINFLWTHALKRCKNIIVSSNQMKSYYEKLLCKKSISYSMIPYGIYEKKYTDIPPKDLEVISSFKESGFKIIGSVGLLIPRKGFIQLLDLLEYDKNLALVLIGEGCERSHIEQECKKKNLSERVFLPGFRNDSYNYYKYFDVYAHVSYSEGFGLAMLEAMSKKLPVICSDLEIYRDYFSNNDVSLFVAGNRDSLICAYEKILTNLEHYRNASYELFKDKFSVQKMAELHIAVYKAFVIISKEALSCSPQA